MAITYNGTPVTAVLMNGVTYTTIADENGYLYYACNPVCYYGNANICYRFVGFEYDNNNIGGNDYARAVIEYDGIICDGGYLCWVGGPRSCNSNLAYSTCMNFQIGCIHQQVVGCGTCATNYVFDITRDPTSVQLQKYECTQWLCTRPTIGPTDACKSISGYAWNYDGGKLRLYSPWVVVNLCDFCSGLTCQSLTTICSPTLFPFCAYINAKLKNEQSPGYTDFNCSFVINTLGSRTTTDITCSIRVC